MKTTNIPAKEAYSIVQMPGDINRATIVHHPSKGIGRRLSVNVGYLNRSGAIMAGMGAVTYIRTWGIPENLKDENGKAFNKPF
jgi:hypothetical protein